MAIQDGRKAPDFTLRDQDGRDVSLKDFAGRNVILFFYPKDDTPGCTREACGFRDLHDELGEIDAAVLGVSPDGAASHRAFIAKFGLPFTLLSDPDKKVMEKYGAWGEKISNGQKKIGVIRSTVWIGPDGMVKRHWAKVPDAATHPEDVLAALRSYA
ncbi:MAG: peroxiredoxin [bacterium]